MAHKARSLTPQSRGRPQAGFAHLRPPLTSNVSPLQGRTPLVHQGSYASAPVASTNTLLIQRWSQQASPAALWFTVAELVPSVTTHQACEASLSKSGLSHTPAAFGLCMQSPLRSGCSMPPLSLRRVCAWPSQAGRWSAVGPRFVAGRQLFTLSSGSVSRSVRFSTSNTRRAKPAEVIRCLPRSCASSWQRANPSVKRTSCGKPQSAAYLER
jgi:hypothetical protein